MSDYLSVSALTKYIKYKFDQDPHLQTVLLKGELSNFKKHSSGHLYFNVKDKNSVISAMMFKGNASKIDFEPKEGDEVLLEARVSVYERRGNYQIYVNKMHIDGIGNLYQKLEQLKKKLTKDGYFDQNHKKIIPKFPKKIAVLTAGTGAAIRDIHTTINSRYPLVEQIQINTLVQGEQGKYDISEKIKQADDLNVDTRIIGSGGGSIEDLWNFNEEDVVKAIYACETPIISAVGHETDFTLSDFVADARAATPTQAAVMATPDQFELRQYIQQQKLSLTRFMKRDDLEKQLNLAITFKVNQHKQKLELIKQSFNLKHFKQNIQREQTTINQKQTNLVKLMNHLIVKQRNNLTNKIENLNNLSPTNTMLRGYTIVNKQDKIVTSTSDLAENDNIVLTMKDGSVDEQVMKVRCNDEE